MNNFLKIIKKHKIFWGIVLILFAIFAFESGIVVYKSWNDTQKIKRLAEDLEKYERDLEAKKTADTIGGNTPQETLNMFIKAVEAGNYELASKYMVIEEQEKWKEDLSTAKNVDFLLNNLKEGLMKEGEYSFNKNKYFLHNPLTSFTLYPSGNWKIEKI